MSIGANIKNLRESHRLTQKELADAIGVSDVSVSCWESGTKAPRMGAIQKIADYFNVLKSDIIEGETVDATHLYRIIERLTPEDQAKAMQYIRFLSQVNILDKNK